MSTLALLPECVLPGCRHLVGGVGDACEACVTAFGPYLSINPTGLRLTAQEIAERDESVQRAYALQRATGAGRC